MTDSHIVNIAPKPRRRRKLATDSGEKLVRVGVLLPETLHQRIEAAAKENFRSVAQEIHKRLAQSEADQHADR